MPVAGGGAKAALTMAGPVDRLLGFAVERLERREHDGTREVGGNVEGEDEQPPEDLHCGHPTMRVASLSRARVQ